MSFLTLVFHDGREDLDILHVKVFRPKKPEKSRARGINAFGNEDFFAKRHLLLIKDLNNVDRIVGSAPLKNCDSAFEENCPGDI